MLSWLSSPRSSSDVATGSASLSDVASVDALDLHASEMAIAKSYFDDAVKCEKDFWDMARGGEGEL